MKKAELKRLRETAGQRDQQAQYICFDEGADCDNAGGRGSAPGICRTAKCQRVAPPGEAGAGGDRIIVYDCLRCMSGGAGGRPSSGGASGSAGEITGGAPSAGEGGLAGNSNGGTAGHGSGGAPVGGAGGVAPGDSREKGCDCGVGRVRTEHSMAALMLLVGLIALRSRRSAARAEKR